MEFSFFRLRRCLLLPTALLPLLSAAASAQAAEAGPRFIGPLATPAPPLPKGRFNIEPYLVSTSAPKRFDAEGHRRDSRALPQWNTSVPIQYGLTDRVSIGATLRGQYNRVPSGNRALALGDTTLAASLGLHEWSGPQRARLALSVRQGLATGRHDRLERRDVPGSGAGASTSTLVLHGQAYFLDGLLRTRASTRWTLPGARASIRGRSVYGTDSGFVGRAQRGHESGATVSGEYSVSPQWTLVGEALYEQAGRSWISGSDASGMASRRQLDASWRLSLLPAAQYHFNDSVGLIAGVQVGVAGRNSAALVAPQVAVNVSF